MGFDCLICEKREIFAFESHMHANICWECHRRMGWRLTPNMIAYFDREKSDEKVEIIRKKE